MAGSARRRLKRSVAHEPHEALLEGRPQCESGTYSKGDGPGMGPTRELVQLAWPIAAAMLGETAIGLVDTKLVGGLGPGALGGVGIATTLMFLGYSVVFGIMRGVKVRTAHAIGEGRPLDGYVYARSGVLMGALIGVAIMLACRDVSGVLRALGTDPSIVPFATDFLAAITLGAPPTCALAALIQHRQAIGDSRTPMVIGIAGNVFNGLFAWGLIYGHFGLPACGVRGGGWATATTETLELAVMAVMLVRSERRARANASSGETSRILTFRRATRDVIDLGLPTGLQFAAEMLAFTTMTAILGAIGKDEIASHQIALTVIRVSFLPGVAVSEAGSVLIGQALGKRRLDEADAVLKSALKIAVGFMACWGLFFALGGGLVAEFFSKDEAVVTITRRLLVVAAVFQVLDAVSIVFRGALRGAKDVRVAAMIGIGVIWLCVPTGAYFLGRVCGLGAVGGWIGFVGETTFGAALYWWRWTRGAWRREYAPRG
ncbi:MAG: Multi antimicrobial extrusion protein [Labilithrix sp.]|nr:Multi antimicrobial extrusion protein [Labilithrix sp.]